MNIVDRVMEEGGPFRENLNSNIKSQTTRKQIPTGQNLEKNKNRMVPLTHNSEGIKNKENEEEFEEEEGVEEILKVIEENENRKRAISPFIGISSHYIYIVVVSMGQTLFVRIEKEVTAKLERERSHCYTLEYRLFLATRKMEPGGQRIGKQGQELFVLLRLARQAWHERHTGLKLHNTSHFQEEESALCAELWAGTETALPLILDFGLIAAIRKGVFSILLEGLIRR
ncbi:hypothetical protein ACJX0J_000415 (mitochondrion) [Zea mays]